MSASMTCPECFYDFPAVAVDLADGARVWSWPQGWRDDIEPGVAVLRRVRHGWKDNINGERRYTGRALLSEPPEVECPRCHHRRSIDKP